MSLTWFELPRAVELGEGWSLRFLTAAQMLECRDEGEARAGEERDKALWADAQLLSRVLLKEGEAPFTDGRAVLERLTAGQIRGLARRWWEQDDFSGPARREEWTAAEESENQHFDMARFLALGGEDPARGRGREEPSPAERPWPAWAWPGEALPAGGKGPEVSGPFPLSLSRTEEEAGEPARVRVYREEDGPLPEVHRLVKLPEPQALPAGEGLTLEDLDRAVERDARRYGGPDTLY